MMNDSIYIFSYNKLYIKSIHDINDINEILLFNKKIVNNIRDNNIIFKNIYDIFNNNLTYYTSYNFISIGSACNLEHKYYNLLPPNDNHQIPPFLNNIIDKNLYDTINIFLIDERLESPPYIIEYSNLVFNKINDNYWKSNNINVYSFKYNMYNYDDEIFYLKKILNKMSNTSKIIINDYSGLEIDKILEYKLNI